MNVDSYYISATGPGDPFITTVPSSQTAVTIPSLLAGDWSIDVVARNTVPENIGGGNDTVTVVDAYPSEQANNSRSPQAPVHARGSYRLEYIASFHLQRSSVSPKVLDPVRRAKP